MMEQHWPSVPQARQVRPQESMAINQTIWRRWPEQPTFSEMRECGLRKRTLTVPMRAICWTVAVLAVACAPARVLGLPARDANQLAMDTARQLHYDVVATHEYRDPLRWKQPSWDYTASFIAVPTQSPSGEYGYAYGVVLASEAPWRSEVVAVIPLVFKKGRRVALDQVPSDLLRRGENLRAAIVQQSRLARGVN